MSVGLKRCPCGKIPNELFVSSTESRKWANVNGSCCGEWMIEFRTNYKPLNSDECMALAIEAWNNAPRGDIKRNIEKGLDNPV